MPPDELEKKKRRFLRAHENGATVTEAARCVGISSSTPYKWRQRDPDFADAWEKARETLIEDLEMEAFQRAIQGNDRLLIFLLKAYKPGTYSEKKGGSTSTVGLTIADLADKVRQWL